MAQHIGQIERRIDVLLSYTRALREHGPLSAWRCAEISGFSPAHGSIPMGWLERHAVVSRVLEDGRMRFSLGDSDEPKIIRLLRDHGGEPLEAVGCSDTNRSAAWSAHVYASKLLGGEPEEEAPARSTLCPIHRRHYRGSDCPHCREESRRRA